MEQKKLETAQELIKDGHYDAARGLLETLPGDPTAQRWLAQIDQYQGKAPQASVSARTVYVERERSDAWKWIVGVVLVVLLVGGIGFAIYSQNAQAQRTAAEYACGIQYERFTTEWQNCVDAR